MKIDHLVLHIDSKYQKDEEVISKIRESGLLYEPTWGKGTKGFKASNIWVGNEYFECVNLLKKKGGGWLKEWVNLYNKGHRGLVCLMLDVEDINKSYEILSRRKVKMTKPEYMKFKWFFNLFTRTMPWINSYFNIFQGFPFQMGLQQMKDEKSREAMTQYMVPNSRDNGITDIYKILIKGKFTNEDFRLILNIFRDGIVGTDSIKVYLKNREQEIEFIKCDENEVRVYVHCSNEKYCGNQVTIENTTIIIGEET
ncbi:hypothetical protein [Anaerosphaera multitolerans]|uniref:Glyoxalase-like domain-containing protein n=1 Tax=Anaerosphaera multitolerans TaxID=2487351 RepID=A0A437S6K5_9FIRM|nr:hypothetical protein [Anaerosphaera multitolerans]RVU54630.1 hypothetical protein EF514_06820 [Anaerosphaera multitolerans]